MAAIVCRKGVIIFEKDLMAYLGIDLYVKVKKTFTRTVMLKHNQMKSARLVLIENTPNGKLLIISRFLAEKYMQKGYLKSVKSNLTSGETIKLGRFTCNPYPYQTVIHDYIMNLHFTPEKISSGFAGVILELEAGLGKTFAAALFVRTFSVKTLYIVPNEYLLEQGIDDFEKCFPDLTMGRYYSKKKTDGDIVFMIVNSATSNEFYIGKGKTRKTLTPKEYFSRFGFAIWDEVHEYATPARAKAFAAVSTQIVLGITAEANHREDKMDFISHFNAGPVLEAETIPNFDIPMEDRYLSNITIIKYLGHPRYTENLINDGTGLMQTSKMTRQVIQDPWRTQIIVDCAIELYSTGHNFFIWCDMREVVLIIRDILAKIGLSVSTPEHDIAHLMGGTTKEEIRAAQNARIVVATYQYAYRGVSLPKFDAMIFATPRRAKIYQTLKRIFRMGGDTNTVREIIDIVDERTKLKNQQTDRNKQYMRDIFGATIKKKKMEYTDINIDDKKNIYNTCVLNRIKMEERIEPTWLTD